MISFVPACRHRLNRFTTSSFGRKYPSKPNPNCTRPSPKGANVASSWTWFSTHSGKTESSSVKEGFHVAIRNVGEYAKTDRIPDATVAAIALGPTQLGSVDLLMWIQGSYCCWVSCSYGYDQQLLLYQHPRLPSSHPVGPRKHLREYSYSIANSLRIHVKKGPWKLVHFSRKANQRSCTASASHRHVCPSSEFAIDGDGCQWTPVIWASLYSQWFQ